MDISRHQRLSLLEGEEDEDEQASRRGLGGLVMSNIVDISRHHRLSLPEGGEDEDEEASRGLGGVASPEGIETGEIVSHINCP